MTHACTDPNLLKYIHIDHTSPGVGNHLYVAWPLLADLFSHSVGRWLVLTEFAQGSVFVEFADFKAVGAFLNADPKPTWDGEELLIMSK